MNPRLFTLAVLLLTPPAALQAADGPSLASRPNILLMITDQQHAGMLSCANNPYVKTPNLDSLARTGGRFERAYCGNPVGVPSRFCMLSGTMPSRIGMESNGEIGKVLAALRESGFRRAQIVPRNGRDEQLGIGERPPPTRIGVGALDQSNHCWYAI